MADAIKGVLGEEFRFHVGEDGGAAARGPLLPLRVLVVADLVPRDPHNAGASPPAGASRVDASRFDNLFAMLRPRIAIEVPSVLAGGRPARVDLSPTSLKSFRPDALCAEVPLLRSLLDGRRVLEGLRDGSTTLDKARGELDRLWGGSPLVRDILGLVPEREGASPARPAAAAAERPAAAAAPAAPTGGADIDALLSMVDLGGGGGEAAAAPAPPTATPGDAGPKPAGGGRFSELIATVAASARPRAGQPARPAEAIAQIERAIGAQIGAILQHPEVRRLEEAWRGLGLLVDRVKAAEGVRIEVVSARPDEAAGALARVIAQTASTEPPASVAIVDVAIDGTAASLARLEEIARVAEAHAIPAVVNGAAGLLGVDDLGGVERLDNKAALFRAPHRAPWRAAAARHSVRWVAIAMNRVLGRMPYDRSTSRIREAAIVEQPADEGGRVWISPAYLVGALIAASFRETAWPCRIAGAKGGGVLGDLPVHEVKGAYEGDEGVAIPTEAFVSTDTQRDLAKSGVLLLASAPNSDAVYVLHAPTAYVPPEKLTYDSPTAEPDARLDRVSLVDQLFVARVVQFLRALCAKLPPDSDPAEVQPVVEGALWALFENAPPATIELAVKASRAEGGAHVAVAVRPRRFLGVGLDEVSLEVPLG
ncbi:type VI secretion system contractile sheath domain-containing protein [Sorangium sp. So ce1335]|uniref:type VI secretion system contractile sheath domain-containing protein n=1 Tax=Sorangium sp. So ce1335 TaxID=3133335 RepID=UPI003F60557D